MNTQDHHYIDWFRHSAPYINAHRGQTFVLMISGEAIADDNFANIIHDIALLNSLGVKLVICHGARPQIEERMRQYKLESHYHNNRRVTDLESLECTLEATGSVRSKIEALLSMGLPNSPMHGATIRVVSGNFVTAKPLGIIDGIDHQHTGIVRRIDHHNIEDDLNRQQIVLLPTLGYSPTGELFNLSLDDLAVSAAKALGAKKLITFDASAGILDQHGQLLRELALTDAQALSQKPSISLTACLSACSAGIERAHILSYQNDGALLTELFTRDGSGTMISRDGYEAVRNANIDDVGGIIELIEPLEKQGILVKRSRELLETEINNFSVIDRDGAIIACTAMYQYPDSDYAELACVVTHPDYREQSRATNLLASLEKRALAKGIKALFVLTTQTAHWFLEQGFVESQLTDLPQARQDLYNYQRSSKVLIKNI